MLILKIFFKGIRFEFVKLFYKTNLISKNSYYSFVSKELDWIEKEKERLGIKND